ncbi:unnamed protein product, partial [Rhizoctonia solani]
MSSADELPEYWHKGKPQQAEVNSWRAARLVDPTHPTPTLEQQQQFRACLEEWNPRLEYGDRPELVMGRLAVQECWRHAVLIYFYMGMCGADSADPRVEASVRQVSQLSATIETDHPLETHIAIPCIVAAAAARKEKHRAILRKKLVVSKGDRADSTTAGDEVQLTKPSKKLAEAMKRLNQSKPGLPCNLTESSSKRLHDNSDKSSGQPKSEHNVDFLADSDPSNAEEWVLFAQSKFSNVTRDLAELQPGLLEFLMSANKSIRDSIRASVCGASFPATRALWLNSVSCSLFQRFLAYFNEIPSGLDLVDRTVDETCRRVMPYMIVLSALGQVEFPSENELEEEVEPMDQKTCPPNAHQNTSRVNPQLFDLLDLQTPTTPQELQQVETQVLQRLAELLEVLINAFENPELETYSRTLAFGLSQKTSVTADSDTQEFEVPIAHRTGAFLGSYDDTVQLGSNPASSVASTTRERNSPIPSPETDWESIGRNLFDKKLYSEAIVYFEKAGLLVERDIATAYESRKQARLLQVAQSVDQTACRAAFTEAAVNFLGCATSVESQRQKAYHLHAAECYLQAEGWIAAAKAYYAADDFDMAARIFLHEGSIDGAVEVVKAHRGDMLKSIVEEILGIARLEYFRTNQLERASELFDEVDEQLDFMENH